MAHNTIDQNLWLAFVCVCVLVYLCVFYCKCTGMLFPFQLMCAFGDVCVQAHVAGRVGKDSVYEIGIICLECVGGCWKLAGASTAGNIKTHGIKFVV